MQRTHAARALIRRRSWLRRFAVAAALVGLLTPIGLWLFVKHVRILAPQLNGVTCDAAVCVEHVDRLDEARRLHASAMASVATKLQRLEAPPLTVFCSTRTCYSAFGGGAERGAAILDFGVILPPESWLPHIVEHEFIHMLQAQQLGVGGRQRMPEWFKEGMPFALSEPPAHDLPEYAKPLVERYRAWEAEVGRKHVWEEAKSL
jgi:hypothetical protein